MQLNVEKYVLLLLIIFYVLDGILCQMNPCPRLLQIEPNSPEPDRWYGTVTLISDADLSGVWLRMIFDRPSLQLGVSKFQNGANQIFKKNFF